MIYDAIAAQACCCSSPECHALGCREIRDRQRNIEAERALFQRGISGDRFMNGDGGSAGITGDGGSAL